MADGKGVSIVGVTKSGGTVTLTVTGGPVTKYQVDNGPMLAYDTGGNTCVVSGVANGTHTIKVWGVANSTDSTTVTIP